MGKKNDPRMKSYAAWMKDHGVRRTTGRCPMCNSIVGIPMDNHLRACRGGR